MKKPSPKKRGGNKKPYSVGFAFNQAYVSLPGKIDTVHIYVGKAHFIISLTKPNKKK